MPRPSSRPLLQPHTEPPPTPDFTYQLGHQTSHPTLAHPPYSYAPYHPPLSKVDSSANEVINEWLKPSPPLTQSLQQPLTPDQFHSKQNSQ
ncbi:hypothetical protein V6N13_072118 [Hibiscus sabdariffa]|uniref:Uncharacterized protein n=1 Tax=Hibiscus sabdariffa TaxID=183260 RepID=A0ABR2TBI0_9ROSI